MFVAVWECDTDRGINARAEVFDLEKLGDLTPSNWPAFVLTDNHNGTWSKSYLGANTMPDGSVEFCLHSPTNLGA